MAVVKVMDLAYVRMQIPDLDLAARFFVDFGLVELGRDDRKINFRSYGSAQPLLIAEQGDRRLAAIGFAVSTFSDLEQLASHLGGNIVPRDEYGGGFQLCLSDPDGNKLELVCDLEELAPIPVERQLMNDARDRYRRKGELFRPVTGPSHILRLGHVVITSPQPRELAAWYREMFGFLVSDEVFIDDETNILLSFNRVDRGDEYVDHHMFQTMPGPAGGLHHVSFEVMDLDDLYVGNAHLAERGYRHMWGVGRHLQGSQIFDYWIDPFGVMYEHWTDTDLLNARSPAGLASVADSIGPWGPPLPEDFITQVG